MFVFSGESLLALLTHYSAGAVPMDARLLEVGVSKFLNGWLGMLVESGQWAGEKIGASADPTNGGVPDAYYPLHVRYEGKRTLAWGDKRKEYEWTGEVEPPKKQ